MGRYKVTVRGTDIELRGYVDGEATLRVTAKVLEGVGIVVASPAADDYNPFGITEPDYPPTPEGSMEVIGGMWEASESPEAFITTMAMLHFQQANVIRGERYRAEQAEAELRDRELHHFEVEQELEQVKASQDEYTRMMVGRVNEAEGVVDRIRELCDQTDTETNEPTQAWLVNNIRAALA